jgi:hypothetical protein
MPPGKPQTSAEGQVDVLVQSTLQGVGQVVMSCCICARAVSRAIPPHRLVLIPTLMLLCRCGHCKRMVGEYKTLGELVQSDPALKGRVVVAKVGTGCTSRPCRAAASTAQSVTAYIGSSWFHRHPLPTR